MADSQEGTIMATTEVTRLRPVAGRNGAAAGRRMPVRTAAVELAGEYEGWHVTVRVNPPVRYGQRMAALAGVEGVAVVAALVEALGDVVREWDFVDEEGRPLPCDAEGLERLPQDLLLALLNATTAAIGAAGAREG